MKTIQLIFVLALLMPIISFTQPKNNETSKPATADKVEAYYFHFTSRCETCKAVEEEAKQDLKTLYPEMIKDGKMSFQAINLDDASSKVIAEKLKVSGQSLFLVKGDKQINITNEGFMYARTNPKKFKTIIKEKVDGLLNL